MKVRSFIERGTKTRAYDVVLDADERQTLWEKRDDRIILQLYVESLIADAIEMTSDDGNNNVTSVKGDSPN